MGEAQGLMAECVMSLYGINRLLRSRKLGPSQLLPSVASVHAEARLKLEQSLAVYDDLANIAARQAPDLTSAISLLASVAAPLGERMDELFGGIRKLGAAERLTLERGVEQLGGDVQALRNMVELMRAALQPHAATFTLSEILAGKWRPRHAFVARRVDLNISRLHEEPFVADPRVLSILVEDAVGKVVSAGVERPFATTERRASCFGLALGDVDVPHDTTVDRFVLELRPVLEIEEEVIGAAARWLGSEVAGRGDGTRLCIPLVAA